MEKIDSPPSLRTHGTLHFLAARSIFDELQPETTYVHLQGSPEGSARQREHLLIKLAEEIDLNAQKLKRGLNAYVLIGDYLSVLREDFQLLLEYHANYAEDYKERKLAAIENLANNDSEISKQRREEEFVMASQYLDAKEKFLERVDEEILVKIREYAEESYEASNDKNPPLSLAERIAIIRFMQDAGQFMKENAEYSRTDILRVISQLFQENIESIKSAYGKAGEIVEVPPKKLSVPKRAHAIRSLEKIKRNILNSGNKSPVLAKIEERIRFLELEP